MTVDVAPGSAEYTEALRQKHVETCHAMLAARLTTDGLSPAPGASFAELLAMLDAMVLGTADYIAALERAAGAGFARRAPRFPTMAPKQQREQIE